VIDGRQVGGGDSLGSKDDRLFESPTLVVVGNLRDLLAGSGSKLSDDTISCSVADHSTTQVCP
jgi:hypothetical protein